VRFIGVAEILGAFGLLLPWGLHIMPLLTPIAAMLLGMIMIPAAAIHYKRREPKNVLTNIIFFACCGVIVMGRLG